MHSSASQAQKLAQAQPASARPPVLAIDLDGTLVRSNLLLEAWLTWFRASPLISLWTLCRFWRQPARLKAATAQAAPLDAAHLPYNRHVLTLISQARANGATVVLATAADQRPANQIAAHLGVFDAVLASDGRSNLRGTVKLRRLEDFCQGQPFHYVGDSSADLPLWRQAAAAVLVNAGPVVTWRARRQATVNLVISDQEPRLRTWARALRSHQWAKNLLVIVPLLAAHLPLAEPRIMEALLALVAFCLAASGVYVLNDLLDLSDDRAHGEKRQRPLAAGQMRLETGVGLAAFLPVAALGLSLLLPWSFSAILAVYLLATGLYSLKIKRIALADTFMLATLYTLRILGGGAALAIPISNWLMALSMFFFLSLAFAKRYVEVRALEGASKSVRGRGYHSADLPLLGVFGIVTGHLAVLVFALYIQSEQRAALYHRGNWLWLICPLMLYWIERIWLLAYRGQLPSDPVAFALKDRLSYGIALAGLLFMYLSL